MEENECSEAYDFTSLQNYFDDWHNPRELVEMLHRIALSLSLSFLSSDMDDHRAQTLKGHLEEMNVLIESINQIELI